ncbi:hypothetical protein G8759_28395 [Spirosoma aureum]|uniref:Uncharacterized protein n=1 Tax=Spirosoma aureum TaxID=2692134 RepID=A0A6G9AUX2_9BACT|nr:hypothetical protein [Spirosoma aureum]QIP16282.1 hypothetical protein G8759_28395 [Spirosoma aureum]
MKYPTVTISNIIRTVLQGGTGCVAIALLIGLSLRWQTYSAQNEIERELSNQTYLELTSNLQNANCTYHNHSWLEPYVECESIRYGKLKLTHNALTYNGILVHYSPVYFFRTDSLFDEFRDKTLTMGHLKRSRNHSLKRF